MSKKKLFNNNDKKNYIRPQTCRNCGINGHLYKDCIHPIMSFGIICYKIEDNIVKYLMIQRKDSLSFMEFIRGKYKINDIEYIKKLIYSMTNNELDILLNKPFDDIWNYTWSQNNLSCIKYTTEFIDSKYKFESINIIIKNIINDYISNNIKNNEQEWGFPKGRRKLKENDLDCAIREFAEETRLSIGDIDIVNDNKPFEEIFYGTNNILYKHTYYISKLKNSDINVFVDKNCIEQIREIRDLTWFSYDEVLQHIKKHNIERTELFKIINSIITSTL